MHLGHAPLVAALLGTLFAPAAAQPGALDSTFGSGGLAMGQTSSLGRDLVLDTQGRVVFVGTQSRAGVPNGRLVGRLLPDGTFDESFDGDGARWASVICPQTPRSILEAVDVTAGGLVVAAGTTGCRRGFVVRLLDNGAPDHSFGAGGLFHFTPDPASLSSAFLGMDVADDGKVVAVGREVRRETSGEIRTYLVVVRLSAHGRPDPSFGNSGFVRLRVSDDLLPDSQLNDLVIYPDGRVLAVGHVLIAGAYQSVVVRLNADGTPDATFEGGGLVVHDFGNGTTDVSNSLVYGPDGAIYIGGTVLRDGLFAYLAARLRFDGTRDPTFGSAGVTVIQATAEASCTARDVVLDLQQRLLLAGDCSRPSKEDWAVARVMPNGGLDHSFGQNGIAHPPAPGPNQSLYGIVRQGDGRLVVAGSAVVGGVPVWVIARLLDGGTLADAQSVTASTSALSVAPNPVMDFARISYSLDAASETTLTVYDALGRVAARVEAGAGMQESLVDLSSLAAGVYVLHLRGGERTATQTITVR